MIKVGDLVNVYGLYDANVGKVVRREIIGIAPNGLLETDNKETCHPKQCRKLVKKKRREIFVSVHKNGTPYCNCGTVSGSMKPGETVWFREFKK